MFGSSVGEPGVLRPPSPGSGRRQGRGRRRWGPGSGQTSPQPSWCRGKERVDAGWAGDSEVRPRDFCVDFRPLPGGRLVRPPRGQAQAPIHDAGGGQTAAPPPDARMDAAVGQAAWDLGRAFSVGSGYCPSKDARGGTVSPQGPRGAVGTALPCRDRPGLLPAAPGAETACLLHGLAGVLVRGVSALSRDPRRSLRGPGEGPETEQVWRGGACRGRCAEDGGRGAGAWGEGRGGGQGAQSSLKSALWVRFRRQD